MAATFAEACIIAQRLSKREECTIYVNAVVRLIHGIPTITEYLVSDWYNSDSSLTLFTNDEQTTL